MAHEDSSESAPRLTVTETAEGGRFTGRMAATLASAVASLLLHGSVLAAAIYWIDASPGAIAVPSEAISIEFLATEVIEAVTAAPSLAAAASLASVQSEAGDVTESAVAAPELRPVAPAEQVAVTEPVAGADEAPAPRAVEALQGALETPEPAGVDDPSTDPAVDKSGSPNRDGKERRRPEKTAKLTEPTETRDKAAPAKKKGSVPARAAKGTGADARVSASAGSAVNYAALVRARVAARKPGGAGRRGTVVVAFGVTRSGGLSFASVTRSSGDAGLDRSVLSAVRSAGPFPPPPPGAALRFAMPFYFK